MDKKIIAGIIIVIAIVGIGVYSFANGFFLNNSGTGTSLDGKTEFKIYNAEPETTESQASFMAEDSMDMGYNNETTEWLGTLNNYVMFSTDSAYIIMNRSEAEKIPIIDQNEALDDATENDLYHYIIIKCDVLETHSMGSGLKDMILVNNVDFVRNETTTLN